MELEPFEFRLLYNILPKPANLSALELTYTAQGMSVLYSTALCSAGKLALAELAQAPETAAHCLSSSILLLLLLACLVR